MGRRMDWCGNSKRGEAPLGDRFAPRARTGLWRGQAGVVLPARVPPQPAPPCTSGPCCPPSWGSPFDEQAPGSSGAPGLGLLRACFLRPPEGEQEYGRAGGARDWARHTWSVARGPSTGVSRAVPASWGHLLGEEGSSSTRPDGTVAEGHRQRQPLGHWAASGARRAERWTGQGRRSGRSLSPHPAQPIPGSWPQGQDSRACFLCCGSIEPPPCRTWGQGLPTTEVEGLGGHRLGSGAVPSVLTASVPPTPRQPPAPQLQARMPAPHSTNQRPTAEPAEVLRVCGGGHPGWDGLTPKCCVSGFYLGPGRA